VTDSGRPARRRTRWIRTAQAVVTVVLLVLLWRVVGGPDVADLLATAHIGWLALAVALLIAHTIFAAWRWKVTAAPLGLHLSARTAVEEYFLAQLINSALPGGVLGDVGRAARSRHRATLRVAAGAVAVERGIGQAALAVVLVVGVVVTAALPGGFTLPRPWLAGVSIGIAGAVLVLVALIMTTRVLARRHVAWAARVADGMHRSTTGPGVRSAQAALSMVAVACLLAAFWCCTAAIGAALSVGAVVTLVPLVLLSMLLPVSIGGWGVRETAAVALLPVAGITGAQALASSIAFGVVALVATLPGLAALWTARHAADPTASGPACAPEPPASGRATASAPIPRPNAPHTTLSEEHP